MLHKLCPLAPNLQHNQQVRQDSWDQGSDPIRIAGCLAHIRQGVQQWQTVQRIPVAMNTPAWLTEYSPTVDPGLTPRCNNPEPICVRVSATCRYKLSGAKS